MMFWHDLLLDLACAWNKDSIDVIIFGFWKFSGNCLKFIFIFIFNLVKKMKIMSFPDFATNCSCFARNFRI